MSWLSNRLAEKTSAVGIGMIANAAINIASAPNAWQAQLPSIVTGILMILYPEAVPGTASAAEPASTPAPAPAPAPQASSGPATVVALLVGLITLGALGLSACANLSDPTTTIVSVEAGYGAALAAENEYLASGKADPEVVKTLHNVRVGVAQVLDPIAAAAAKGTAPTSDQALAAQTALTAFQAVLQANGLTPKTTTSTGN